MNSEKTIISLCSGTGSWEKPYVENGYMEEAFGIFSEAGLDYWCGLSNKSDSDIS